MLRVSGVPGHQKTNFNFMACYKKIMIRSRRFLRVHVGLRVQSLGFRGEVVRFRDHNALVGHAIVAQTLE